MTTEKVKSIAGWLTFATIAVISSLVIVTGQKQLFGWQLLIVRSGSMQPTIATGSVVLVQPQNRYQVGDIITYAPVDHPDQLLTHRITANSDTGFITQGDANDQADRQPVALSAITGKVRGWIPWLGYALAFIQTPVGTVLLIVVPGTLLIYEQLRSLLKQVGEQAAHKKAAPVPAAALILLTTLALTSVAPTWASYAHYAKLDNLAFHTGSWQQAQIVATQNEQDLELTVNHISGFNKAEYTVTYTHVVEGEEVNEAVQGQKTKTPADVSLTFDPIYLGTCSTEEVCTPHQQITDLHIQVVLKTGETVGETLDEDFEWNNETD